MKTSTKFLTATGLVAAVAFTGVLTTSAYRGDPTIQGPNYSEERHEEMEDAFDNLDYEAWAELMDGRGRVTDVVTAENFAKFKEAHDLAEAGDLEGARAKRAELGLGLRDGSGNGSGRNGGGNRRGGGNGLHNGSGAKNGDCPYASDAE